MSGGPTSPDATSVETRWPQWRSALGSYTGQSAFDLLLQKSDLLLVGWMIGPEAAAVYAIAIGLGGSVAMGVFQVKEGVDALFGLEGTGMELSIGVFAVLCLCYALPLTVDLSRGMAVLSNTAMAIATAN